MANNSYWGVALVVLVLVAAEVGCASAGGVDALLRSYFPAAKPSSYFVSIESNTDSASRIVSSVSFHEWFGLRVSPHYERFGFDEIPTPKIQHATFILADKEQQIAALGPDGQWAIGPSGEGAKSATLTIRLMDLCRKYFIAKPTFLAIEREGLALSAIESSFWDEGTCVPQVVLLKANSEIQEYLSRKRWERTETVDGYSLFVHQSFVPAYAKTVEESKRAKDNAPNPSDISAILQLIKINHPSEASKSDEQLLTVLDVNSHVLSIPDILEKASFRHQSLYILLRGYSQKKSMIILDRSPQEYSIESHRISDSTVKNITLFGKSPFSYVLLAHPPNESVNIFEEKKIPCERYIINEKGSASQLMTFLVFGLIVVLVVLLAKKYVTKRTEFNSIEQKKTDTQFEESSVEGVDLKSVHEFGQKNQPK